jgi:hypothetical protein
MSALFICRTATNREVGTHFERHTMMYSFCAFVGSQVMVRENGALSGLLSGLRNHLPPNCSETSNTTHYIGI